MPTLSSLARLAASTLLVTAAACADSVTKVSVDEHVNESASSDNAAGPAPSLVATARMGTSADFSGLEGSPGTRAGYFYRVEIAGSNFPAGVQNQARLIAVTADGSKRAVATSGGNHPGDGTYKQIWSASCPSHYAAMYLEVASAARITTSNRVDPGC